MHRWTMENVPIVGRNRFQETTGGFRRKTPSRKILDRSSGCRVPEGFLNSLRRIILLKPMRGNFRQQGQTEMVCRGEWIGRASMCRASRLLNTESEPTRGRNRIESTFAAIFIAHGFPEAAPSRIAPCSRPSGHFRATASENVSADFRCAQRPAKW